MAAKNSIQPVERHEFNCLLLTGSYQVVSSGGFSKDLAVYKLYNGSSSDIDVSYDGVTDHDIIPAGGTFVLDVQANSEGARAAWPAGREMFVKGTASGGSLYETGYSISRV